MKTKRIARRPDAVKTRGFSLLEIILVLAIIAVIAGSAVPVASRMIRVEKRRATRAELELLGDAALEYFRDTNNAPRAIADLETDPKRADSKGWAGPYLTGAVPDLATGKSNYEVDGWSHEYTVDSGTNLSITSSGPDERRGGQYDVAITVDFTPIRREKTHARLRIINQAVLLYNGQHQTRNPLPADYAAALSLLVREGFLPDAEEYARDAWGRAFVADPEGKAPLVKVRSKSM